MNFIKSDIEKMLPTLTWDDFTLEGDVYVTTYIPQFEDEDKCNRYLRLRDKYPSEYAAALVSCLPEGATLQSYDHMSLKLIVTRA
jgi:hypothetical protein